MKKLLIIGHGQHGKDTVAEMLRDNHGFAFVPASWTFAEDFMTEYMGYDSVHECYDDRVKYRNLWGDMIAEYNTPDPAALAKRVMTAGSDIYVGCRRRREFHGCMDMFDHILWVSDPRKPPEPATSMEMMEVDADITIQNDGTLEDLADAVAGVVEYIR